jgi:hypothetical protein
VLVLLTDRSMKYAVEMDSGVMIYIPSVMQIGTSVQAILRLVLQIFERLQ